MGLQERVNASNVLTETIEICKENTTCFDSSQKLGCCTTAAADVSAVSLSNPLFLPVEFNAAR
jgi:hypothetical protein